MLVWHMTTGLTFLDGLFTCDPKLMYWKILILGLNDMRRTHLESQRLLKMICRPRAVSVSPSPGPVLTGPCGARARPGAE